MRTIYTLVLAAVVAVMSGCGISATVYNQTIVAMHENATNALSEKMEQIFDFENTSKEEAQTLIDELTTMYDDDIAELDGMKYPKEAADWHKSVTDLDVYIRDNVLPLFAESLKHEPESEDWYDIWNQVDDCVSTASDLEDLVIDEQVKFAAAMGMRLVE